MALSDIIDWVNEFGSPGHVWYAKRLSANDTLANHTHQAGPYIPKELLFELFPSLNRPDAENPDLTFDLYINSMPIIDVFGRSGTTIGFAAGRETKPA